VDCERLDSLQMELRAFLEALATTPKNVKLRTQARNVCTEMSQILKLAQAEVDAAREQIARLV
jgi:hypothetical protein